MEKAIHALKFLAFVLSQIIVWLGRKLVQTLRVIFGDHDYPKQIKTLEAKLAATYENPTPPPRGPVTKIDTAGVQEPEEAESEHQTEEESPALVQESESKPQYHEVLNAFLERIEPELKAKRIEVVAINCPDTITIEHEEEVLAGTRRAFREVIGQLEASNEDERWIRVQCEEVGDQLVLTLTTNVPDWEASNHAEMIQLKGA